MKRIIFIITFFLTTSSIAIEKYTKDDIVLIWSDIDGECYYTNRIKPDDKFSITIDETCDEFLNFNKLVKEIEPLKAQLPISGEVVSINYETRIIQTTIIENGKEIGPLIKTKKGKLFAKSYKNTKNQHISEYFDEEEKIEFKVVTNTENDRAKNKEYIFYKQAKQILNLIEDLENNTILIKQSLVNFNKNDLIEFNTAHHYTRLKITENEISKLITFFKGEYANIKIANYNKGQQDGIALSISERYFDDLDFFTLDVYEDGELLADYHIMTGTLTFETIFKKNLKHGVRYYWDSDNNPKRNKCYDNGKEIEFNECDVEYLKDERIILRNQYFKKLSPSNSLKNEIFQIIQETKNNL